MTSDTRSVSLRLRGNALTFVAGSVELPIAVEYAERSALIVDLQSEAEGDVEVDSNLSVEQAEAWLSCQHHFQDNREAVPLDDATLLHALSV